MTPDSIGNKDLIAVVMSKQPLDWFALNAAISKNTIGFSGNTSANQVMACIVEIDKSK